MNSKYNTRTWKSLLQLGFYIIILNFAIFTTSVVLHELGHLTFSGMECSPGRIVLADSSRSRNLVLGIPTEGVYTEITCPEDANKAYLGLTGFPFVVLFALAFLLLRIPERNFGFVLIGLSLMLAGLDILLVIDHYILPPLLTISGLALILLGEIRLINKYIPPPEITTSYTTKTND